jgi:hypothetical protein
MKITLYEDHIIWRSHYMKITLYEDHIIWRSLYMKITLYEDHIIWRSLYMKITLYEDHIIWRSHYMKITFPPPRLLAVSNMFTYFLFIFVYLTAFSLPCGVVFRMIRRVVNESSLWFVWSIVQECASSNWRSPLSASVGTGGDSAEIRIEYLSITSKKLHDLNKFVVQFEMTVMLFVVLPVLTLQ